MEEESARELEDDTYRFDKTKEKKYKKIWNMENKSYKLYTL